MQQLQLEMLNEILSIFFVLAGNVFSYIAFFPTLALCPGRYTARTAAIFMQHDVHTIIQKGCKQLNLSTIAKGVMDAWIRLRFGFSAGYGFRV